jgi:hypothetical protein
MNKTITPSIKIIDDFFEVPDLWRSFALELNYNEIDRGLFITDGLNVINSKLFHSIAKKISLHYQKSNFSFLDIKISASTEQCLDTKISQDDTSLDFSAIIFLNPEPVKDSGLSFYQYDEQLGSFRRTVKVENFYNRCVIYDNKTWLSHDRCFGENIESGRLIIKMIGKSL